MYSQTNKKINICLCFWLLQLFVSDLYSATSAVTAYKENNGSCYATSIASVAETQRSVRCLTNALSFAHLPKSMNCFIDKGEGENLENLSTCFGIPATEPLFSNSWANLIFSLVRSLLQHPPVLTVLTIKVKCRNHKINLWNRLASLKKLATCSPSLFFSSCFLAAAW